jgi:hypothetical protein
MGRVSESPMMFNYRKMNTIGEVIVLTVFGRFTCSVMFTFQLVNIIATVLNCIGR